MVTEVTFGASTYKATMMDNADEEPHGYISVGCCYYI